MILYEYYCNKCGLRSYIRAKFPKVCQNKCGNKKMNYLGQLSTRSMDPFDYKYHRRKR
jgi:hypothetical protein